MDEGIDDFGDVALDGGAQHNGGLIRFEFVIALESVSSLSGWESGAIEPMARGQDWPDF